ncbi:MAG: hypothetical protein V9G08_09570 [Dermatophilaceae bacterium]
MGSGLVTSGVRLEKAPSLIKWGRDANRYIGQGDRDDLVGHHHLIPRQRDDSLERLTEDEEKDRRGSVTWVEVISVDDFNQGGPLRLHIEFATRSAAVPWDDEIARCAMAFGRPP